MYIQTGVKYGMIQMRMLSIYLILIYDISNVFIMVNVFEDWNVIIELNLLKSGMDDTKASENLKEIEA